MDGTAPRRVDSELDARPLQNPAYFARVEVDEELGTIAWPNGADIAPETLHRWVTEQRAYVPV